MFSAGPSTSMVDSFDINKFEDLLDRLAASNRRLKNDASAVQNEAQREFLSSALS